MQLQAGDQRFWAWDHPVASSWIGGVVRRLSGFIPV
jgi:hypothetical protein